VDPTVTSSKPLSKTTQEVICPVLSSLRSKNIRFCSPEDDVYDYTANYISGGYIFFLLI